MTRQSDVEEHLEEIAERVRNCGRGRAGHVTARIGDHPDVETVWEPTPPLDPRDVRCWVETADTYYRMGFGRYEGKAVAAIEDVVDKTSPRADPIPELLAERYTEQPETVVEATKVVVR